MMMGFSQGTHSPTFAFSEQSQYFESKVELFLAIGPTIIYKDAMDFVKRVCSMNWVIHLFAEYDMLEAFNRNNFIFTFMRRLYKPYAIFCRNFPSICSASRPQSGTSWKNIVHVSQIINAGQLQKYDYGSAVANNASYGTPFPPEIDYKKIKVPYAMFMGESDEMSSVRNNKEVLERMPEGAGVHCEIFKGRGHFLIGENIDVSWFEDVLTFLTVYYSNDPI